MADQEQNRNEAATPFKLEEARRRGVVPKSLDANSFFVLLAATIAWHFWGSAMIAAQLKLAAALLSNAHQMPYDPAGSVRLFAELLGRSLSTLAPLFLLVPGFALLSNLMQSGPVFSFHPLKPDVERLNPAAGFKRVFAWRMVVETGKTLLKFVLLGGILYFALSALLPALATTPRMDTVAIAHFLGSESTVLVAKLLAALAVIAMADIAYSRWDFAHRMRMSRNEIREELKRREGDPRIKARLRELQREAVKRSKSLKRIKDADVLIVNPVRLAVAVQYDRARIDAPVVIAKGAGFLARRMRHAAARATVPIVENKGLARALFLGVDIDQAVPPAHYGLLAKILSWAFAIRGRSIAAEAPC